MTTVQAIGISVLLVALVLARWSRTRGAGAELLAGVRRAAAVLFAPRVVDPRRPCPTCGGLSRLLCGVEPAKKDDDFTVNEDDFRLWECHSHGCFDAKGTKFGERRVCAKCGHREAPTGEDSCGCIVHLPVPCCATMAEVDELDGTTGAVVKRRKAVGRCTYSEPRTMTWSPEAKA